ncbi:hypothetical protein [Olsenella uli]
MLIDGEGLTIANPGGFVEGNHGAQLHLTDAVIRATVEALVEARGSSSARSYTLSGKVYALSGKGVDFVRQSDIDKVRYPELIMKLAKAGV